MVLYYFCNHIYLFVYKKNVFLVLFWFCFGFVLVLFWFCLVEVLFSAVERAFFMCALVAGIAAYANAVALALATDIRGVSVCAVHKHLEHAEPVVQVV